MRAVGVGVGFAAGWAVLYGVLSFVTQLWAGSQFSEGQGGGLRELIKWLLIFGAIAVTVVVERAINGSRIIQVKGALIAAIVGHLLGTGIALIWFTWKGGPEEGDWWVAPACATLVVALWSHLVAPTSVDAVKP